MAAAMFAGKRLPREKRSIMLSAARAWIFNQVLQARVLNDTWNIVEQGDTVSIDGSNSIFVAHEVDEDIIERTTALRLHPTGPLWGKGSDATELGSELQVIEQNGQLIQGLERVASPSRRPLRAAIRDLEWEIDTAGVTLQFFLGSGSYATAVLREIFAYTTEPAKARD